MSVWKRNLVFLLGVIVHMWALGCLIASIATPNYTEVDDFTAAHGGAVADLTGMDPSDPYLRASLYSLGQKSLSYNMFRMCATTKHRSSGNDEQKCKSLMLERGLKGASKIPDWLLATQAFTIMGTIFASLGYLLASYIVVVQLCSCADRLNLYPRLAGVFTLIAGVFIMISVIIYGVKHQALGLVWHKPDQVTSGYDHLSTKAKEDYDDHFDLAFGFYLSLASVFLFFAAGVKYFLAYWFDQSVVKDYELAERINVI